MTSQPPRIYLSILGLLLGLTSLGCTQMKQPAYPREEVKALMMRVMTYQTNAYGDTPTAAWVNWQAAPFWAGVMACYRATGDEAFYEATKKWGEGNAWRVGRRTFHADDVAVGQAYLEMYLKDKDPRMLADVKNRIDQYFDKGTVTRADVAHGTNDPVPMTGRNLWWWCDALFMAPPVLTRLYAVTGDKRYLDLLHSMWWDTTAYLFDESEGLYFRDDSYFFERRKSPTGRKIFWGRGNGWVYGGIIRTLDHLPKDDPQRQKYIDLYRKMTAAIVKYQGEDGLWRASVNEPTWISQPESSCTGFYTFGLLAGIHRGYIDRETYLPNALKGWKGLQTVLKPDGGVGYAQQVGAAPENFSAESTKDYAQGAYLLAASELYQMTLSSEGLGQ